MRKKIKVAIGIVAVMLSLNIVAFAGSVANSSEGMLFNEIKIYGSDYTLLAKGRILQSPYNVLTVKVDNMYDLSGSTATYNTSLWAVANASNGAILVSGVAVTKGNEVSVEFTDVKDPAVLYGVNVKGNQANKDALISGIVKRFNKGN